MKVVVYYSPVCRGCELVEQMLIELSREFDIEIETVNVLEHNPENLRSVPAVRIGVETLTGLPTKDYLRRMIERHEKKTI